MVVNDTSITTNATSALHEPTTASEAVVDAVADEKGVSPTDVRPPLYAVIDPDALDEIVSSMNRFSDDSPGHVTFSYAGYEVTVSADGDVSLAEDDAESEFRI